MVLELKSHLQLGLLNLVLEERVLLIGKQEVLKQPHLQLLVEKVIFVIQQQVLLKLIYPQVLQVQSYLYKITITHLIQTL
ncbi:MAG: hypothetical protein CMJ17_14305 [Phenylobacterium sp.]|nr:hypothetical protein [Phenylobacterium sp.]